MNSVWQFLDFYSPQLLRYVEGRAPASPLEPSAMDFVELVLEAWRKFAAANELDVPSPEERTFWHCLYLLEELNEYPDCKLVLPYEKLMMQNLINAAECLKKRQGLPPGFFATRPGEELCEDFDVDDMLFDDD